MVEYEPVSLIDLVFLLSFWKFILSMRKGQYNQDSAEKHIFVCLYFHLS